ncbi:unnamed protein product [Spirodela intermedia]|uniref:Uncharacterized protein n=1 Tax=Spirodela intermedia TaxID=51605 RepID=A0A7I8L4C0_SPIIN|nr:unnamed protein product [Spirodela intermedia]
MLMVCSVYSFLLYNFFLLSLVFIGLYLLPVVQTHLP